MKSLQTQRTLVDQAYDAILGAICDGTLAPNERLTQDEIANRLAVSRQPVMSALGLLKQQGFLIEHGRRGLAVAPIDRARFDSIYEYRTAIEPFAARLATVRITPEQLARGRELVAYGKRVAAAGDAAATLQADVDFHTLIYEASGNPLIVEAMRLHWQHLRRSMGEVLRRPSFAKQVWLQHAAILEAIAQRKADEAARLIGEHVGTAHQRVGAELMALAPAVTGSRNGKQAA